MFYFLGDKMKDQKKVKQGKKNRQSGADFERRVRKDLESNGWICDKWTNNVDLENNKLIPAKRKYNPFNKVMAIGTGMPDFIAFKLIYVTTSKENIKKLNGYEVIGVECKVGKYLDADEKEKCRWLLDDNIFSKILIAYKTKEKNKIKINYIDFEDYAKNKI